MNVINANELHFLCFLAAPCGILVPQPGMEPVPPALGAQSPNPWTSGNSLVTLLCICLVARLCPTLCNPMDCSPPGSSVHGESPGKNIGVGCPALLQGIFPTQGSNRGLPNCRRIHYHQESPRILEWAAYPFSKGTSRPRNQAGVTCIAGRVFTS